MILSRWPWSWLAECLRTVCQGLLNAVTQYDGADKTVIPSSSTEAGYIHGKSSVPFRWRGLGHYFPGSFCRNGLLMQLPCGKRLTRPCWSSGHLSGAASAHIHARKQFLKMSRPLAQAIHNRNVELECGVHVPVETKDEVGRLRKPSNVT